MTKYGKYIVQEIEHAKKMEELQRKIIMKNAELNKISENEGADEDDDE